MRVFSTAACQQLFFARPPSTSIPLLQTSCLPALLLLPIFQRREGRQAGRVCLPFPTALPLSGVYVTVTVSHAVKVMLQGWQGRHGR